MPDRSVRPPNGFWLFLNSLRSLRLCGKSNVLSSDYAVALNSVTFNQGGGAEVEVPLQILVRGIQKLRGFC